MSVKVCSKLLDSFETGAWRLRRTYCPPLLAHLGVPKQSYNCIYELAHCCPVLAAGAAFRQKGMRSDER